MHWVRCDRKKCKKWRRLADGAGADDWKGKKFTCDMNEWDEAFNSCSSPLEVYDINFNNEEDENSWKLYLFIYFCFLILTHCDICKKKSQQRNDMYWRNLRSTNWRVFQAPAYSKANKLTSEMLNQKGSAKWHKHKNVIFLETDGNWITNSSTKTKPRSSKAPNWTSIRSYALVRESFVMANHTPASIEAIKQELTSFLCWLFVKFYLP